MKYCAALLLASACSFAPGGFPKPLDVAHSTFRIDSSLTLDVSEILPETPTLPITIRGTAWDVGWVNGEAAVATAGHMCPTEIKVLDAAPPFAVLSARYSLVSVDGETQRALVVSRSDDPDLCVLTAVGRLWDARPLPLATDMPDYGDPVSYIGAPDGLWGNGSAPYYTGVYAGGNLITAPTSGGASGSAVWSDRGVVGVLVAVERAFNAETFIVTLDELRRFLADSGVEPYAKMDRSLSLTITW